MRRAERAEGGTEVAAAQVVLDAQGSALFDKITELPEYYPTRAEREILRATAAGIADQTRARTLIELGSGSSDKTRLLLDALRAAGTLRCYVPVDVASGSGRRGEGAVRGVPGPRRAGRGVRLRGAPRVPRRGRRARAPAGRLPRQHDREPGARSAGRFPGPGPDPAAAG